MSAIAEQELTTNAVFKKAVAEIEHISCEDVIEEARSQGYFLMKFKLSAGNWGSCSVAEQFNLLGHSCGYVRAQFAKKLSDHDNQRVLDLGVQFDHAVDVNDYVRAKEIHWKIRKIACRSIKVNEYKLYTWFRWFMEAYD